MMPSSIYFPVRGNASSLLAGRPAASVRRRMIVGALMHDHVIVDDGLWTASSGPQGGSEMHVPGNLLERPAPFQSASKRARAKAGNFYVAMKRDGSPGPAHVMVQSSTTIAWRATFDPIKRELPHAYPWIDFVDLGLDAGPAAHVRRMVQDDTRDGVLAGLIPDQFSRKLVIGSANNSLVMGALLGAGISLDAMHQRVVQARLIRGEAHPVYGGHALSVVFPAVDHMDWADVHRVRQHRAMTELRAILAEVEEAAWGLAASGLAMDQAVHDQYRRRFHEAARRLSVSPAETVAATLVGVGIALMTAGHPLLIGVAAGAGYQIGADRFAAAQRQRSWIAAADQLDEIAPAK
jgi:hypothetical protein